MRKENPACYECPKGKSKLHTWRRNLDQTATCVECGLHITRRDAVEVFTE